MADWTPITLDELSELVTAQLRECDESDRKLWSETKLSFERRPFRYLADRPCESFFVVAALKDAVILYDDVEDGFGIARNEAILCGVYWYERLVYAIRNLPEIADELENGNS